jgi:hypothetical protein
MKTTGTEGLDHPYFHVAALRQTCRIVSFEWAVGNRSDPAGRHRHRRRYPLKKCLALGIVCMVMPFYRVRLAAGIGFRTEVPTLRHSRCSAVLRAWCVQD